MRENAIMNHYVLDSFDLHNPLEQARLFGIPKWPCLSLYKLNSW